MAQDGLPVTEVDAESMGLLDALLASGLAMTPRGEVTLGQARKLVQSNAVVVNGEKTTDLEMMLSRKTALYGKYQLLQKGKKTHHMIVMR